MDRRSFLGRVGATVVAGLAARTLPACAASGGPGSTEAGTAGAATTAAEARLGPLGVQLYTVRAEIERDVESTLRRVAEIGYSEVEFAGYFDRTAPQIRSALDSAGLSSPATHILLEPLEQNWDETIEFARTVGHRWIVVPWLHPNRRRNLEDYRQLARQFNSLAARLRAAGFSFGYHNHEFEFTPIDGQIPFDILLQQTDPATVDFELDIFWITKGGQDPLAYFERHPGRFPLVHVKDSAGPPEHRQVSVGEGAIDWRRLLIEERERAGIQHVFVEHDHPTDPFATIAAGFNYLRGLESGR